MTEHNKTSRTVAELIKELQQFPPDMRVDVVAMKMAMKICLPPK